LLLDYLQAAKFKEQTEVSSLIQTPNSSIPIKDKGYLSSKEILIADYFINHLNFTQK